MSVYDKLYEYICGLEIIDTHEHLPDKEECRQERDVIQEYLVHYFRRDLISAGLPLETMTAVENQDMSIMDRWQLVADFWKPAVNTGYGRALDIAARDLYGIEGGINADTIEALNQAFCAALEKGNHYEYVLKQKSKIKISILDSGLGCDKRYFRSVCRLDGFIRPESIDDILNREKAEDIRIQTLGDWEMACEMHLDSALDQGAIALKSGLAYLRPLKYEMVSRSRAEDAFNEIISQRQIQPWADRPVISPREFQDYMMHFVLSLADQRGLTFQFHTGLQEGNGNYISNSDPALMCNLFLAYPNVRFDIFHISYPYQQVLSAIAKNFQNVFIDMCWAHIISPVACVNALDEWLDAVPANKISAFGGDYCFIDGVYGHQYLARQNVARSLERKVEQGVFDIDRAREVAHMLFIDNPTALFNLDPA